MYLSGDRVLQLLKLRVYITRLGVYYLPLWGRIEIEIESGVWELGTRRRSVDMYVCVVGR